MKGETTIKPKLYYFIPLTVLLVLGLFLPKYHQISFIFKHGMIFIYAASVIGLILRTLHQHFLKRYPSVLRGRRLTLFKGFTLGMLALSLFTVSFLQDRYIALYETPPVVACYYYDDYGNYLHGSRMEYQCPELEILKKSETTLEFRAAYRYQSDGSSSRYHRSNGGPYYQGDDGYALVDVTVDYNDEKFITDYAARTSIQYQLDEYEENPHDTEVEPTLVKYYNSHYFTIHTDYSDSEITQEKESYLIEKDDVQYDDITNVKHHDFTDEPPTYSFSHDNTLKVVEETPTSKQFEVVDRNNDDEIRYSGSVSKNNDGIKLSYERNPEEINITPNIIADSFAIEPDGITHTHQSGDETSRFVYDHFEDVGYIQTKTPYSSNVHVYDRDDFLMVEGQFQTHKVLKTDYGYRIEEYHGDNTIEETPDTDSHFLRNPYAGKDYFVFEYNPITLQYDQQPMANLNPMVQYLYKDYLD